jgi:predicted small lipoprotein YifL
MLRIVGTRCASILRRQVEMTRILVSMLALAATSLLAGCGNQGKTADPPATIQAVAGDSSVVVSFSMDPGVEYWLFYAPSSSLTSTNFTSVAGGRVITNAVSPQGIAGLINGTTYYFTINGRTNSGPGGSGTSLVSATPRPAGNTWNPGKSLVAGDLRGATFGTVFVVVGANGAMFSTSDGVTWTALNYVVSNDLNAVSYGNSRYVAVGAGGVALLSTDAITWTAVSSGTTSSLNAGASNGVASLAVGAGGTFTVSSDGQTWVVGNAGTSSDLYGLTFGNGIWVAVGANGVIVTSTDTATWQAVASQTSSDLKAVTYSLTAATFVAVGAGGTVVTSPDGVNWTSRGPIASTLLAGVSFGSQFAAVGNNGSIFTSADGIKWEAAPSGTTSNLNALAFGNLRFLAAGAAGTNLYAN